MTRVHRSARAGLALCASIALLACGIPSPGPDAGAPVDGAAHPDGAARDAAVISGRDAAIAHDGGRDAVVAVDASTIADAGSDAAIDASVPHGGVLEVAQYMLATGPTTTTFTALFGDFAVTAFEHGDLPGCTRTASGPCIAVSCSGSPPPVVGAGAITVTVGTAPPMMVSPGASGTYSSMTLAPLATAAMVTTSAAGGVVPAFTLSATTPSRPVATLPTSISIATPLTITWDASVAATDVTFGLTPSSGSGRALMTCLAPGSDGTLTVDPTVLTAVRAGGVFAIIAGIDHAAVDAGDYTIELRTVLGSAVTATINP
jgi:hypothetical protein